MNLLSVAAVMQEREEIQAQIEAIEMLSEQEGDRAFTDEEKKTFQTLLAKFEETEGKLETAKKRENMAASILQERKEAVARQVQGSVHNPQLPAAMQVHKQPPQEPVINVPLMRKSQLEAFDDPKDAHCAGMWFLAALHRDPQAIQWCRDNGHLVEGGLGFETSNMDAGSALMFGDASMGQVKDVPAQGGILVPTIVANQILDVRDRVGAAMRCVHIYPMAGSDDHNYPKNDTDLTVTSQAELSNIATSYLTFTDVQLRAKDKYTLTPISNTLLRNKPGFAGDTLAMRIGHAFAKQIDEEWINGDGNAGSPHFGITGLIPSLTGTGTAGLIPATGATGWDNITKAHITNLKAALADKFYTENTKWLCSRAFFHSVFEPLIETRGGSKSDMEGATGLMYQGLPVITTDRMATAFSNSSVPLILGDFRASCVYGDRESIGISSSEHVYFHQDAVAVRGRTAYDIQNHRPGDGSTPGGYVGLQMPAS